MMLYIYTSQEVALKAAKTIVVDTEAFFLLRYTEIVEKYQNNAYVLNILKQIEGVTYFKGEYLEAKFGATALRNISTGGKGCILAVLYNNEFIVSTDEMGYNCINLLCRISEEIDIFLISSSEYTDLPVSCEAYVNGFYYGTKEDILYAMEEAYE